MLGRNCSLSPRVSFATVVEAGGNKGLLEYTNVVCSTGSADASSSPVTMDRAEWSRALESWCSSVEMRSPKWAPMMLRISKIQSNSVT